VSIGTPGVHWESQSLSHARADFGNRVRCARSPLSVMLRAPPPPQSPLRSPPFARSNCCRDASCSFARRPGISSLESASRFPRQQGRPAESTRVWAPQLSLFSLPSSLEFAPDPRASSCVRRQPRHLTLLRPADPQLPVRDPHASLGTRQRGAAHGPRSRRGVGSSSPRSPNRRSKGVQKQSEIVFDEGKGLSTKEQQYDPTVHHQRWSARRSTTWRQDPEPSRLAGHARDRPPAPALAPPQVQRHPPVLLPGRGRRDRHLADRGRARTRQGRQGQFPRAPGDANHDANPELLRLALKLATGAGKTTVMAMLIAWQTINAVRRPGSKHFTRGFLIVPPASPSRTACASCSRTTPTATT
jgi:hypothetical protein